MAGEQSRRMLVYYKITFTFYRQIPLDPSKENEHKIFTVYAFESYWYVPEYSKRFGRLRLVSF